MSDKLAASSVQQDEAERTVAVRGFPLGARDAGAVVTFTAKPVLLSPDEAGELAGVSRDTIIGRIGAGETGAVVVGTHRKVPLSALGHVGARPWQCHRRP